MAEENTKSYKRGLNIRLSEMQENAVDSIVKWYKKKPIKNNQIFYLAGYAGSGKSTLVPFCIDAIGVDWNDVCFATFTGKAALVLSEKTGVAVSTIHSLCYELVEEDINHLTNKVNMVWRIRKHTPLSTAKLLVLDEVSMVTKYMMEDLKQFNIKILVLGDPFQLPPVDGDPYFHEQYKPDFFLSEIHRQALENPIIMLSQQVRLGHNIQYGNYGDTVIKVEKNSCSPDLWLQADQIIVGTNKTRHSINRWVRKKIGFAEIDSTFPVENDRLICLKNRWDDGLINGMMLKSTSRSTISHDRESFKLSFLVDGGNEKTQFTDMNCSSSAFMNDAKLSMPYHLQKKLVNIDFGYAITCHKAQGSQYEDVLFIDEGFGRWLPDNTYYRHLYTAITRTSERLIIVE